ncbi:MAG: thiopeptide-type bacteriocin biosynthesis protein [Marinifilaceae bacterium]
MNKSLNINNNVLFLKVYVGTLKADELLVDLFQSFNIHGNEDFDFFFIRYADPDPHLRLRFFFRDRNKIKFYLESILKYFGAHPFVRNVTIDDYHRELERYGVENIVNCEKLFFTDSANVAIMVLNTLEDQEMRLRLGIGMFSYYLEYCFEDCEKVLSYLNTVRESYREEFNYSNDVKNCVSKHYRLLYSGNLISEENELVHRFLEQNIDLDQYRQDLRKILRESTVDSMGLIGSLIHMFYNRLFPSYQRELEYLSYELMVRLFRTKLSLEKKHMRNNLLPCDMV